jgi:starch synthase
MKVLFVGAESVPFIKSGGLGDVLGSLPHALSDLGIEARVLIPHYGVIDNEAHRIAYRFRFQYARPGGMADVNISKRILGKVPYYCMQTWPFFNEPYFYTDITWDSQRYIFFCQAALAFTWEILQGADDDTWFPDVIHVNDWHTGLIPFLLQLSSTDPYWGQVASVLTIHNMAYQGPAAGFFMDQAGIPPRTHPALIATGNEGNMLGIGIAYADKVNTVSPQHAIELHYPPFGEGLQDLIIARDADFSGILNGIDMERYNPATDQEIFQRFDADNFRTHRLKNKTELQRQLHLPIREDVPVIGLVSRLVEQKGIDFGVDALRRICIDTDIQVLALGTGQYEIEGKLWSLGNDYPNKVRAITHFDPILAQKIYAGSDLFLIPSRYEPCGITQMMAMRYGSLPVVRETGGLIDTVVNYDGGPADVGTGFRFLWETDDAVVGTLRWAIDTYRNNRPAFERMQERAMRQDWSWHKSATQYIELYEAALAKRRG